MSRCYVLCVLLHFERFYTDGFLCEDDGEGRHSLMVSSVSAVLDHGVWVIAQNHQGQDSCFIDVKTYRGRYGTLHSLLITAR